jgi:electron transfer flavoprotein beta subunit
MKIAVCVKQIPDPEAATGYGADNNLLREGEPILDDSDSYGVEVALRLAAQSGDGEVTLISMAPDGATAGLRTALAMGAAGAVLVSDPALKGVDALGTARVLAEAIRRLDPTLVVAATESTDGYTGTMPVQLAEILGLPAVSFTRHVELDGDALRAERQTEGGYEEVACPLPAVITVTAGVVEVRYPTFKGIMSARSKPAEVLSLAELGVDPSSVGTAGARQEVVAIDRLPARTGGEVIEEPEDPGAEIVARLREWKIL